VSLLRRVAAFTDEGTVLVRCLDQLTYPGVHYLRSCDVNSSFSDTSSKLSTMMGLMPYHLESSKAPGITCQQMYRSRCAHINLYLAHSWRASSDRALLLAVMAV